MLKVMEYRKKLKALRDEGNGIIGKAGEEKRTVTEDEQKRLDSLDAEMTTQERQMDSYIKINRISE